MTSPPVVLGSHEDVDALRRALACGFALFEVRGEPGAADWRAVSAAEPFDWNAALPLTGAKRFLFPPRETLLHWHGDEVEAVRPRVAPFVLFGLRACDLAAIGVLDRFFAADPHYHRRRSRALLVGVNCLAACEGGFCREVAAGPFARDGFDLALTRLGDGRVFVEVGSAHGADAIAAARVTVTRPDSAALADFGRAQAIAHATFPDRPFVAHALARIDAHAVADAEWQALGPVCLACTGCTSLCPTCSCFTVVDEACDGAGERVRVWDSCLLEGFQREASGHHPAPRPGDRVRRFWHHKLGREFETSLGRLGCVGCGRCDVTCPGEIGALRVLGAVGTR